MKKKVAFTLFDLHFGGISNLLLYTLPYLSSKLDVMVIYFGKEETMLPYFLEKGIEVKRVKYEGFKSIFTSALELKKVLKEKQIDYVFTSQALDRLLSTVGVFFYKPKIVSFVHSASDPYAVREGNMRKLRKFEDFFHNHISTLNIFVSKASLNSWRLSRSYKSDKTKILYSGIPAIGDFNIDNTDFTQAKKIFIIACRFTQEKGLIRLIDIFNDLNTKTSDWELRIVGDGTMREELENLVVDSNLQDNIKFLGFRKDLDFLYKEAHFYINSSFTEALPVSIIEAMSVGLPVIASNVGGIPEVVEDNKNGYIVDFSDKDKVVVKLLEVINFNDTEYKKMSNNSFDIYSKKFSIDTYVQNFLTTISEL